MDPPVQTTEIPFHESKLWSTPLRDPGVKIEGTPLEPVLDEFRRELDAAGIRKLSCKADEPGGGDPEKFGTLPRTVAQQVEAMTDPERLKRTIAHVFRLTRVEELS